MGEIGLPVVISYDPEKVYLLNQNVIKITDDRELLNICHFRECIKNQKIFLTDFGYFKVQIPNIESFSYPKLEMEFLCGYNLETLLKKSNRHNRNKLFRIVTSLFTWFYNNLVVWHDFAPRNVIINFEKEIINFVDFERGFVIMNSKIEKAEYYYYLSNIIAEEWSAFLTIDEFNYLLPNFWDGVNEIDDKPDTLTSKRKFAIFKVLYHEQSITTKKTVLISRAMQEVAQAENRNGFLNFPLIIIERMTKKLGVDWYAQIIAGKIKRR
jgi:tRNA A-37 threonylcarbamoyl transferase component Bud32